MNRSIIKNNGIDAECGYELVVVGYVGEDGTKQIAQNKREELLVQYSEEFIGRAFQTSPLDMDKIFNIEGIQKFFAVGDCGIMKALWRVAEGTGKGIIVQLFDIPIRQVTVELCNFCDINPYEMISGNCILLLCKHGRGIVRILTEENIPCAIVGEITDGNDKLILHDDVITFLRPSKKDAICKLLDE